MKTAIYAGSFDPITNGHVWMINQGAKLFDRLYVVLAFNPQKTGTFNLETRRQQIQSVIDQLPNVSLVVEGNRYVADLAQQLQAQYLLRGIRNFQDFEYEKTVEQVNLKINPSLQTVYLTPPHNLAEISSSLVKSLVGFPGWQKLVTSMVPLEVVGNFLRLKDEKIITSYWQALAGVGPVQNEYLEKILENHSQPHRFYHNLSHLVALFRHAQDLVNEVKIDENSVPVIKYCIFFHDLVYNPQSKTNEQDSALIWEEFAKKMKFDDSLIDLVKRTILATASHSLPTNDELTDYFLDLDLSILGSQPEIFKEYENQIRMEYSFVPENIYQVERAKIMKKLINPYKTNWGKQQWDKQAKENLKSYE